MLGVDRFGDYGVVIKFMQQTRPDTIFPVRREILRRVKNRFDEAGHGVAGHGVPGVVSGGRFSYRSQFATISSTTTEPTR